MAVGQDLLLVRSIQSGPTVFGIIAEAVGAWETAGETLIELTTQFDKDPAARLSWHP